MRTHLALAALTLLSCIDDTRRAEVEPDATQVDARLRVFPDVSLDGPPAAPRDGSPDVLPDGAPDSASDRGADVGVFELVYRGPSGAIVLCPRGAGAGRPQSVALTFLATRGRQPASGEAVAFELEANGVGPVIRPESARSNGEGEVSVQLFAGGQPATAQVCATAHAQRACSPRIDIPQMRPGHRQLTFQCEDEVVPGFTADPGEMTGCALSGPVPPCAADVQVLYSVEAGVVGRSGRLGERVPVVGAAPNPYDMPPYAIEPDGEVLGAAPRDGWVTVMAFTRGQESFLDGDGDERYTPELDVFGPEHDLPEPYVDANESGEWDEGELFLDSDGDQDHTPANGVYNHDANIWFSTRLLWVGPVDDALSWIRCPACEPSDAPDCDVRLNAAEVTIEAQFVDARHNCPGAYNEGGVELTVQDGLRVLDAPVHPWRSPDADLCFGADGVPRPAPARWRVRAEALDGPALVTATAHYAGAAGEMHEARQQLRVCP